MPQAAKWNVRKVAVLGAGTMGARIAAHFANCGIPVCLLDLPPAQLLPEEERQQLTVHSPSVRNRIARQGLEAAKRGKPAAFFTPEKAEFIHVGNFEDHMAWLGEADWILEAVAEDLAIKRELWRRVLPFRTPGTVVSTNTSGLSIAGLAGGLPEEFQRHWLGTHFFNPPRYLRLLEIIPGPQTLPEVIEAVAGLADRRLGKGVVVAKDTPNFIANRIGVFCCSLALRLALENGLSVETTDQLLHEAAGWPRSALFGTLDLVGLDIFAAALQTVYDHAPKDERRDLFRAPAVIETMLARGLLGNKSGGGFYRRPPKGPGSELLVLDLKTLDYRPAQAPATAWPDAARKAGGWTERLPLLLQSQETAGRFLWQFLSHLFLYCANRIPEIADTVVPIDRAMRWGYGWQLGPFELWDVVGVKDSVRRMEAAGMALPANLTAMRRAGSACFYEAPQGALHYYDFSRQSFAPAQFPPGILLLRNGPRTPPVVRQNESASLRDLGDGVLCVEFHSQQNVLDEAAVAMVESGLAELPHHFDALVIGNQGNRFCAGADLRVVLRLAHEERWEELDRLVRRFQQMNQAIKYSLHPVVVAVFHQTLGGGCEMALAAPRVQALAETYMGLVEAAAGLVPAGGGLTEMLIRLSDAHPRPQDLLAATRELSLQLSQARVSSCAEEARQLGYLRATDGITMNPDRLLADAQQAALALSRQQYRPAYPGP
ncbi:MAG TPA: 3-hydroxyacyl-CoA dehydrogenase/enoyl-CoA hydratase family protein, partial [Terriglobia bacterium]|nr:3-hydroxyacyl-CoA dehydrogenase/enoyl-CoA hydratase family protein [Terriglobia bacterium]